jgi:integrase/recombinase XerC
MNQVANQNAIDRYLDSLLTQRKLSPHTIAGYSSDLIQLAAFAGAADLASVTHFQIRQFASKLHAKDLHARSISRKLSAWRGFYQWLAEQSNTVANPVDGVKAPRRAATLPKALSVDDAVRLVASGASRALPDEAGGNPIELCNRAMFELLYSSGLRVSELVALDIRYSRLPGYISQGWIDMEAQEVTVTGKGSKMRTVPVGMQAIAAIKAWMSVREQPEENADVQHRFALFVGVRKMRITPRAIQLRLKAHAQALGIPVNVHPHVLRHSFASHMLQSSGDLRAVQEMLGHSSIASTQVYTALDFQHLAQVYDAAHPRAKKK